MQDIIRVMLIEDDPMVQEVNRLFIEKVQGFEVSAVVSNGKEGLERMDEINPDLIILDNFMPEKSGLETIQSLRKNDIQVDVIVVTAAKDKETIMLMKRYGAFDYIVKPFKFERIKLALEQYRSYKNQLSGEGSLGQTEIDFLQGISQEASDSFSNLPKGLNTQTLEQITNFLKNQSAPLSAEETAEGIGIARVTARRYLEFLQKNDHVALVVEYGSIGRPINRYKWK